MILHLSQEEHARVLACVDRAKKDYFKNYTKEEQPRIMRWALATTLQLTDIDQIQVKVEEKECNVK